MIMKWVILTLVLLLLVACSSDLPDNETVNETVVEVVPSTPDEMYKTNGDFIPKVNSETAYPELNQTMKVRTAVQNYGVSAINNTMSYTLKMSRLGVELYNYSESVNINLLATEEQELHEFEYTFDQYGDFEIELIVDEKNTTHELKEDNNVEVFTVYVREAVADEPDDDDEPPETGLADEDARDEVETNGCYDSDGGKEYNIIGTCYDDTSFENGRKDFCSGDERLAEGYCEAKACTFEVKSCSGVCRDGRCI